MNNDVNNISPMGNSDADKLKLLHQINVELNDEIFDDEDMFDDDAAEGLQQIPESHVTPLVNKLNADLHRQIKKKKKQRRGIPSQQGLYVTIITILLLAAIAYIVIKKVIS
jgi:hypothetical protein